ncbi:Dihydropteroate synthase [Candidatus Erwinia haradaeae]|uniref:Dihydropteroate synthase n=1 Tax=Candidatus Erwinia haradaeae TaxID=1922217 RepID=A0A451DDF3_9GAMM|nr:dihydropteroate synthase [Candidatus Erwinia haradaeae]VFP84446.1 Dihydropteroate synthase [Candidatus Erwinia haradaeae]
MKLYARDLVLDLSRSHVMGILNITPDSFFDGGKYNRHTQALNHVQEMIHSGATIIDVGGESSRPYAKAVSLEQELERVIPIIESIVTRFNVWVSVNTSQPKIMQEAACAGVHMINDIRSLQIPGALSMAATLDLPICLTHMQGEPNNMQDLPYYQDVLCDVKTFFVQRIAYCKSYGIKKSQLLLDPGFGFGKNLSHNYQLLAYLADLHYFRLPLLVGLSRKRMIGQLLNLKASQCLLGSLSCAVIAAIQGAHILRVHDVRETVEALRIVAEVKSARECREHHEHV